MATVKRLKRAPTPPQRKKDAAFLEKGSIPFAGNPNAPILMVLDPVVGNLHAKKPFDSRLFEFLKDRLKQYGGFTSEDVCFLSACPPVSGETWGQNKLLNAHLKEHYEEFQNILKWLKPKLIVPCGAKACQQVVGRSVQITKVRGQAIEDHDILGDITILPMLSPFYAQRHPETEAVFNSDIGTMSRLHKADYNIEEAITPYEADYRWCTDLSFLLRMQLRGRLPRISLDCETKGLRPFQAGNKLLTVQICYAPGKVVCVPIDYNAGKLRHHDGDCWHQGKRDRIIRQLKMLLESKKTQVIGQNLKYDWLWLFYYLGIKVRNYQHDTILLAHLHDENTKSQNLDDLVRIHVPEMAGYNDVLNNDPEHHGKTRMDLLTPPKMLQYACGDADATWRLLDALLPLVQADAGIWNCYNRVVMPAMRAFCWIEQTGFPVDVKALRKFHKELRKHQQLERIKLLAQLPKSIKEKHRNTGVGLKPDRQVILKDYLYLHEDGLKLQPVAFTKTGQPSVSAKTAMPYYVADHPWIAQVTDYIKNQKMLSTYVRGFYKYIIGGKIRPSYLLHGTVTGRSSSKDPNGQNFPKRGKFVKSYRSVFKAPPGWVFVSCDLSQAELRIAAMMSGDETMLDVYRNDGDIHTRTAMGIMGIQTVEEWDALPEETKKLKRFQAKAVNFGFLYGMWWKKFRSYAKTEYGVDFTEQEAQQIRELFFDTYPSLESWHEAVRGYVMREGKVRTYDGRVRHLPMVYSPDEAIAQGAQRQAINSPVQSIASDLGLIALGRLIPHLNENNIEWLKVCGFIHDAVVCLVREEHVAEGIRLVRGFMEDMQPLQDWFNWTPEVPIKSDAEIGRTLSKTYELKPKHYEGDRSYAEILQAFADDLDSKSNGESDLKKKNELRQSAEDMRADAEQRAAKKLEPVTSGQRILKIRSRPRVAKANRVRRLSIAKKKAA